METIFTILCVIIPRVSIAKLDIKDAYYEID